MKVKRLKSDCCGMKVGEAYETKDDGQVTGYVQAILPDGSVTSPHWVGMNSDDPWFELAGDEE